jgi:hypothetical protein
MPVSLDKEARIIIVLATDQKKPVKDQPRFIFQPLAMGKWSAILKQADNIDVTIAGGADPIDALCQVIIQAGLIGWENMRSLNDKVIRFNKKRLADIITFTEAWELFRTVQKQGVEVDDLKN